MQSNGQANGVYKGGDDAIAAGLGLRVADQAESMEMLQAAARTASSIDFAGLVEPIRQLGTEYQSADLDAALVAVAAQIADMDRGPRSLVLGEVTKALKSIKATRPSEIVLAYFERPPEAQQQQAVGPVATVPCADPVDGQALMDAISAVLKRYTVLPAGGLETVCLWILHTYALKVLDFTPRLIVRSPVKRCGKTTLLKIVAALAEKGLYATNITSAVLYRVMEAYQPTLIADEADTWLRENEELRGVFNAGFEPEGVVFRCVGDEHEPKAYRAYGAAAIGAIGELPDTITDRGPSLFMRRKLKGERVAKLRRRKLKQESEKLRPMIARWVEDNLDALTSASPSLPRGLHDRAEDYWEGMLAIADLIGGDWPARARHAAVTLSGSGVCEDEDVGVMLLADIRYIFELFNDDRMKTERLLGYLTRLEERPWCEWSKGKPLTAKGLAGLLRRFGVISKPYRISEKEVQRGYLLASFADTFSRYLDPSEKSISDPPPGNDVFPVTTLQPNNDAAPVPSHSCYKGDSDAAVTGKNPEKTAPNKACNGVTAKSLSGGGPGEKNLSQGVAADDEDPLTEFAKVWL